MQDLIGTAQETALLTPEERDRRAAQWFEQRCGLRLEDRPISSNTPNQTKKVFVSIMQKPLIDLAVSQAKKMLQPASETELSRALASLSLLVAMREGDDQGAADLQLLAYIAELRRYPADIALHVVSTWHRRSAYWPQWKELQDVLDVEFARRRTLLAALQTIEKPKEPEREYPPPTEEERAQIQAICDRTVAVLRGGGKPKPVDRGLMQAIIDGNREAEAAEIERALHPEIHA